MSRQDSLKIRRFELFIPSTAQGYVRVVRILFEWVSIKRDKAYQIKHSIKVSIFAENSFISEILKFLSHFAVAHLQSLTLDS
jgi:hypothetical protein